MDVSIGTRFMLKESSSNSAEAETAEDEIDGGAAPTAAEDAAVVTEDAASKCELSSG